MIVPLDASQIPEAAATLGAAFRSTPLFLAALHGLDEAKRERKLTTVFRSFALAALRHGQPTALLTDGRVSAVALTYPPGSYPLPFTGWLRNGLGVLSLGLGRTLTLARVESYMQRGHFAEPHFYLYVLGVAPAHQGRGQGGALVRELAERADRRGMPCYLETDDPKNVGYYQRFGFEVTLEGRVPALPDVTLWQMLRRATP